MTSDMEATSGYTQLREAEKMGLVSEDCGRHTYVAVSPSYAAAPAKRRRVMVVRVVVCALALISTVFAAVGQGVSYHGSTDTSNPSYTVVSQLAVWHINSDWTNVKGFHKNNVAMQTFAVCAVVFAFLSLVLSAVYAAQWLWMEKAREEDWKGNKALIRAFHARREHPNGGAAQENEDDDDDDDDAAAHAEFMLENFGLVSETPLESQERLRRQKDDELGIATFSMLLCCAVSELVVVFLMGQDHSGPVCYALPCAELFATPTALKAGYPLFVISFVLACVAFLLLSVPGLSQLYLCYPPHLPRGRLMTVAASKAPQQAKREMRQQTDAAQTA